jgi:hypothetical protein
MNSFKIGQLVVVDINSNGEKQPCVAAVHKLVIHELDCLKKKRKEEYIIILKKQSYIKQYEEYIMTETLKDAFKISPLTSMKLVYLRSRATTIRCISASMRAFSFSSLGCTYHLLNRVFPTRF